MKTPTRVDARTLLYERFVAEYTIDLNATQAYHRAKNGSVTLKTAAVEGWKLLRLPAIQQAIATTKAGQLAKKELTALRVLEELRRIAFLDPGDLFDAHEQIRSMKDIPEEARACIVSLKVARANFDKTDGKKSDEWLHEVKLANKVQALDLLARHFRLVTDVMDVNVNLDAEIERRMAAGRDRARARKGRG